MNKPHKHAAIIKAWADGADIEYRDRHNDWVPLPRCGDFDEHPDLEYRIKPEEKPDIVISRWIYGDGSSGYCSQSNVKFTFDGETGKLKSAEVIK